MLNAAFNIAIVTKTIIGIHFTMWCPSTSGASLLLCGSRGASAGVGGHGASGGCGAVGACASGGLGNGAPSGHFCTYRPAAWRHKVGGVQSS